VLAIVDIVSCMCLLGASFANCVDEPLSPLIWGILAVVIDEHTASMMHSSKVTILSCRVIMGNETYYLE